jgi:hypothetical protein
VRKIPDSGSTIYGGPLDNLLIDQVVEENARIFADDRDAIHRRADSTLACGER